MVVKAPAPRSLRWPGTRPHATPHAAARASALDESGIRWRVIIISACYAGGFVEPLRDPFENDPRSVAEGDQRACRIAPPCRFEIIKIRRESGEARADAFHLD